MNLPLQFALAFGSALVMSLVSIPAIIRFAHQYKFLDVPDGVGLEPASLIGVSRKIHTRGIPRLGGLPIVLGFLTSIMVLGEPNRLSGILLPSMVMFLTGFFDDFKPLPAKLRLCVQIVCAMVAVVFAKLHLSSMVLGGGLELNFPYWLGASLAVFIIVGAINAINLIDGLDGLAGGIVFIAIGLLSYIHFLATRNIDVLMIISFPIMGALMGFLRFNTHPASVFMGDGGSNWLGFMVGVLMLITLNGTELVGSTVAFLGDQSRADVPFLSTILCVGIPVFDVAIVMIRRLANKKSLMAPDKGHFHHKLLDLGLTQSQSVATIYFIAVIVGVFAISPIAFPRYSLDWLPILAVIALPLGIVGIPKIGNNPFKKIANVMLPDSELTPRLRYLLRRWEALNRYTIYGLIGLIPLFGGVASAQLGKASLVLAGLLLLSIFFHRRKSNFIDYLFISLCVFVLLICINQNPLMVQWMTRRYSLQNLYNGLYIFLFFSTILHVLVTFRKGYLYVTPTDFLLVTLPLLVLLVPVEYQNAYILNVISLRSLVLFTSLRTIVRNQAMILLRIKKLLLFALLYISLTSLFGFRIIY